METTTPSKKEQLLSILPTPDLILDKITSEEILNSDLVDYNPSEAKKKLEMYSKHNPSYYIARKDKVWDYDRLFIKYSIEGFEMFKSFSLFHSMLSNSGFRQASIIEIDDFALVTIIGFGNDLKGWAENNKANRLLFAKNKITVTDY